MVCKTSNYQQPFTSSLGWTDCSFHRIYTPLSLPSLSYLFIIINGSLVTQAINFSIDLTSHPHFPAKNQKFLTSQPLCWLPASVFYSFDFVSLCILFIRTVLSRQPRHSARTVHPSIWHLMMKISAEVVRSQRQKWLVQLVQCHFKGGNWWWSIDPPIWQGNNQRFLAEHCNIQSWREVDNG